MLSALGVPPRDRYQVYHEHPPGHLVVEDTGAGNPANEESPGDHGDQHAAQPGVETVYTGLYRELKAASGIEASDTMVSIVTNSAPDWSFGNGEAQFVTGKLGRRRLAGPRQGVPRPRYPSGRD